MITEVKNGGQDHPNAIYVYASREASTNVTGWVENNMTRSERISFTKNNALAAYTKNDTLPKKLNFAIYGILTIIPRLEKNPQEYICEGIILAQGSSGLSNNWWLFSNIPFKKAPIAVGRITSPKYLTHALIEKTGSTNGFRAYISVIPDQKIGIVILVNKFIYDQNAIKHTGRELILWGV